MENTTVKIGQLLVASNIVQPQILAQALLTSKNTGTPLGRVLLSIGEIDEGAIDIALQVQGMIRSGVLDTDLGVKAINVAVKNNLSITAALNKLGWKNPNFVVPQSEFEDLIIISGISTSKVLDLAKKACEASKIPLGRYLVLNKLITPSMLASVLTAQVLIRDGKIKLDEACAALRESLAKQQTIEDTLQSGDMAQTLKIIRPPLRLGDMLCEAGIISQLDKISAVEIGLVKQIPIGQVLIQLKLITEDLLNDCLNLQNTVKSHSISERGAIEVLKNYHLNGGNLAHLITARQTLELDFEAITELRDFITESGLISSTLEKKLLEANNNPDIKYGEIIYNSGFITKQMLVVIYQAKRLYKENIISLAQAYNLVNKSKNDNFEFFIELESFSFDDDKSKLDNNVNKSKNSLKNNFSKSQNPIKKLLNPKI